MIEKDNNTLKAYTGPLSRTLREEYTIGEEYYRGDVKRGLRNSDGTRSEEHTSELQSHA